MRSSSMFRVLTLLTSLAAWADSQPAYAQRRGGSSGGQGGFNLTPPLNQSSSGGFNTSRPGSFNSSRPGVPSQPMYGGGYRQSGGNDAANIAGQILQGINQGLQQQQMQRNNYPRQAPPLGGSNLGGLQNWLVNPSNLGETQPANSLGNGSFADALGQQPQYQQPQYQNQLSQQPQYQQPQYQQPQYQNQIAGGPNPGQPYQIPTQYANYSPGTVINWGQYRYQLGSDGTMTSYTGPAQTSTSAGTNSQPSTGGPTPGQRYQIPAQYAGTTPGTPVSYGGNRYIANNDGTMTAFTDSSGSVDSAVERTSTGPVPGKRYQIPVEQAGVAPGTEISHGGNRYLSNTDGTMTAMKSSSTDDPSRVEVAPKPVGPVLGKRYQIPAEHADTAPGSVITYGGNSYVANDDGTMTAFKSPE